MTTTRRELFSMGAAAALATLLSAPAQQSGASGMYGIIGRMNAVAGHREELIEILLEGTREMPGCLSYVVSRDREQADALWITEVWESEDAHAASLELPGVRAAIERGRPLIAGFGERILTEPVGGHGIGDRL
jgi:quinol monooxygenase YgiN